MNKCELTPGGSACLHILGDVHIPIVCKNCQYFHSMLREDIARLEKRQQQLEARLQVSMTELESLTNEYAILVKQISAVQQHLA